MLLLQPILFESPYSLFHSHSGQEDSQPASQPAISYQQDYRWKRTSPNIGRDEQVGRCGPGLGPSLPSHPHQGLMALVDMQITLSALVWPLLSCMCLLQGLLLHPPTPTDPLPFLPHIMRILTHALAPPLSARWQCHDFLHHGGVRGPAHCRR